MCVGGWVGGWVDGCVCLGGEGVSVPVYFFFFSYLLNSAGAGKSLID